MSLRRRSSAASDGRRTSSWGVAAGEHAAPVADLEGPAQVRWDDPVGRPMSRGWESGPMTIRVMVPSQASHAGAGGGDAGAEAGLRRRRGRWRVGEVGEPISAYTCGLTVRRIGRLPAARVLSAHCTNASPSCWARVRVSPAGRSACSIDSSTACIFCPPTGVEVEAAGHGAVGVGGDGQRAALGGVGFGAVGVEPFQVVVHDLGQLGVRAGGGDLGQRGVHSGEVDALRGGGGPVLVAGDRGDHRDLLGGDPAVGERGRHRRQVLQRPAGADQPVRGGR